MSSPARAQRRREGRALVSAAPASGPPLPPGTLDLGRGSQDQAQAVLNAAALGLALDQANLQPGCVRCVRKAKTAEAAGEEMPDVHESVTWLPDVGPVCYGCFGA